MVERKIIYDDVLEYEFLFTLVPSLILKTMVKTNANLIAKFETKVIVALDGLNPKQREMLDIILKSPVDELQEVMKEAYAKSYKKQYKILSEPKARPFIEKNIKELRKLVELKLND